MGELGVLFAQGVEVRLEGGHAGLEAAAVEVAVFEGVVVAVEGALAAADLLGERTPAFFESRSSDLLLRGSLLDGSADEGSVAVERGELPEYGPSSLSRGVRSPHDDPVRDPHVLLTMRRVVEFEHGLRSGLSIER